MLPVAYSSQSHGQSSYSSDDLPKNVVMTLSQGATVKSMDFHPLQQILLLGKPPCCELASAVSSVFSLFVINLFLFVYLFIYVHD